MLEFSNQEFFFLFNKEKYKLSNSIKRNWEIHPKCNPSDFLSLGGNTLVLSSNDPLANKYLELGTKLLLNN